MTLTHGRPYAKKTTATLTAMLFMFRAQGDKFSVLLQGHFIKPQSITFALERTAIAVRNGNDLLLFQATVTLNNEGRCVAKIDNQELEFWQVRQKALEGLFFDAGIPLSIPAD